jgi:hypothetical protein
MIVEINYLPQWIPEQMSPGTVFVLDAAGESGDQDDPFWAVLACPACATLGLITRKQMAGVLPVMCGSDCCSAQFHIRGDEIIPRLAS